MRSGRNDNAAAAVDTPNHGVYLLGNGERVFVAIAEVGFLFAEAHDLLCQRFTALAAVLPDGGDDGAQSFFTAGGNNCAHFLVCIRAEAVYRNDAGQPVDLTDIPCVAHEVRKPPHYCGDVFLRKSIFRHTAVHFQRTDGHDQNDRCGRKTRCAALYVEKLFRTEVCAEARLRDGIVAEGECGLGCDNAVAAVCDICKGSAVDDGGRPLKRLDEVGLYCVLQKRRHCPDRL